MHAKRLFYSTLVLLALSTAFMITVGPLAQRATAAAGKPTLAEELQNEFAAIAEQVKPCVVYVDVARPMEMPQGMQFFESPGDDMIPEPFRDFFRSPWQQPRPQRTPRTTPKGNRGGDEAPKMRGVGSGVIIDAKNGYILTNNHVVEGATEINVTLHNDKKYPAKLKGTDMRTDVAVIQIDAPDLQAIEWGDSDALKVGHWVMAFGQPDGLKFTVTKGIVSAKGRAIGIVGRGDRLGGYEDFIQTDAAINPGNSGGPLTDIRGRLVGINTAIATNGLPQWGGIGFAIPSNLARKITAQLIETGEVVRGYIGVEIADMAGREYFQDKDKETAAKYDKDVKGAFVHGSARGGPAEKAGVKAGDVIVAVDGKTAESAAKLREMIADKAVGSTVELGLLRLENDKATNVTVKVEVVKQPKTIAAAGKEGSVVRIALGITAQTLTPEIAVDLGYGEDEQGVVVTDVTPDSRADKAGLRSGDLVTQVKHKGKDTKITSAEEFDEAVSAIPDKEAFSVLRKRDGQSMYVKVE